MGPQIICCHVWDESAWRQSFGIKTAEALTATATLLSLSSAWRDSGSPPAATSDHFIHKSVASSSVNALNDDNWIFVFCKTMIATVSYLFPDTFEAALWNPWPFQTARNSIRLCTFFLQGWKHVTHGKLKSFPHRHFHIQLQNEVCLETLNTQQSFRGWD